MLALIQQQGYLFCWKGNSVSTVRDRKLSIRVRFVANTVRANWKWVNGLKLVNLIRLFYTMVFIAWHRGGTGCWRQRCDILNPIGHSGVNERGECDTILSLASHRIGHSTAKQKSEPRKASSVPAPHCDAPLEIAPCVNQPLCSLLSLWYLSLFIKMKV